MSGISDHALILGVLHDVTCKQVHTFRQVRCYGICNLDKLVQ